MKDIIKTILYDWKDKRLPQLIPREKELERFLDLKPKKIIVISGFRRVGKTYLMYRIIEKLLQNKTREETIYINFEDERIVPKTEFLTELLPTIKETFDKETKFLFLDEIQVIDDWSKWMRRIYDNYDCQIFVSGSSSKMSSKEIPTELRGRYIELRIFPLSFNEFLFFRKKEIKFKEIKYSEQERVELNKALNEYLIYGGLPEVVISSEENRQEIISSYYKTVISRDIVERWKIKNEEALKALLRLLLNSKEYSISKLYNTMKSLNYEIGKKTVQEYLSHIENSWLMFSIPRFSFKIKDQLQYPRKNYFIDNAFITFLSTKFSKNYGRLLENLVAVRLWEKFNEQIFYWRNMQNEEVDFLIKKNEKVQQLIQVCYDISEADTKQREVRALLKASKELKCKNLLIITLDYETEEKAEWFGIKRNIKFIPLWKWLLNTD